jgi:hypothetical protein
MTNPMKLMLLAFGLVTFGAGRADAAFLTYIDTATLSGSLGGTSFTDAKVTVSGTGDTDDLYHFQGFPTQPAINLPSTTVTVAGIGTATFTNPFAIVYGQGLRFAGFAELTTLHTVLGVQITTTRPYDLTTPIGPLPGVAEFTMVPFQTSLGVLEITSSTTGTFTAAIVPEPSSLALCGIAGVVGLAVARARRKRAT